MTPQIDLPPELWLRIAHFIPDENLYALASLNHLFLDAAEDRRYRHLVLDDDNPDRLLRKLLKIQNDAKTASRVHTLEIHPRAIRSAWLKQHSKSTRSKTKAKSFFTLPTLSLPSLSLKPLLTLSPAPPPNPQTALTHCPLITTLLTSLSRSTLKNLERYTIHWPGAVEDEMAFCFPLLSVLWGAVGAREKLRVLCVEMPLGYLSDFLLPMSNLRAGGFERLEKLELRFSACTEDEPIPPPPVSSTNSSPRRNVVTDQALRTLAKFILSLSSTLTSLKLSSSCSSPSCPSSSSSSSSEQHIDFSPFFQYLSSSSEDVDNEGVPGTDCDAETPPLSHLTHLTLDLPIDALHFPDPSGLNTFLKMQLKTGGLKALKLGSPNSSSDQQRWLEDVLDGVSLPVSMSVSVSAELPWAMETDRSSSRQIWRRPHLPQSYTEEQAQVQVRPDSSTRPALIGPSSSRSCRTRTLIYPDAPAFAGVVVRPWAAQHVNASAIAA